MKNNIKPVRFIAVTICIALSSVYIACLCTLAKETSSPPDDFIVVIDAGHGGIDGGVEGVNSKVKESELNLDIARKLRDKIESTGAKVVMTRKTDLGLYGNLSKGFKKRDLKKRMEIADKANADLFVSIHLNYFSSPKRRGAQVFYKTGDAESKKIASVIQKNLNELGEREILPLCGDYYVLNEAKTTAILCECGFLSNEEEEKLLLSNDYRMQIANKILEGIETYRYGLTSNQTQQP